MKTLTILAALLTFFVPTVLFAAPLTIDQANSLIAVVQSSPETSANAFTGLITAFSNITQTQAESLIAVVQAAPGVPANSFVNMLLAFTVDTLGVVVPPAPISPTPPAPVPTPVVTPVVVLPVMEPAVITYIDTYRPYLRVSADKALDLTKTILPDGMSIGKNENKESPIVHNYYGGGRSKTEYIYSFEIVGMPTEAQLLEITFVDMGGNHITKNAAVQALEK